MIIINLLRVLFTITCWVQTYPYSKEWDVLLNKLLKEYEFKNIDYHTADLGKVRIWIANHPYASFHPYINYTNYAIRPKRITMLKAYNKLNQARMNLIEKELLNIIGD